MKKMLIILSWVVTFYLLSPGLVIYSLGGGEDNPNFLKYTFLNLSTALFVFIFTPALVSALISYYRNNHSTRAAYKSALSSVLILIAESIVIGILFASFILIYKTLRGF